MEALHLPSLSFQAWPACLASVVMGRFTLLRGVGGHPFSLLRLSSSQYHTSPCLQITSPSHFAFIIKPSISLQLRFTLSLSPPSLSFLVHSVLIPPFVCGSSLTHLSDGVQIGGVPVDTVTVACDRVTDQRDLRDEEGCGCVNVCWWCCIYVWKKPHVVEQSMHVGVCLLYVCVSIREVFHQLLRCF